MILKIIHDELFSVLVILTSIISVINYFKSKLTSIGGFSLSLHTYAAAATTVMVKRMVKLALYWHFKNQQDILHIYVIYNFFNVERL